MVRPWPTPVILDPQFAGSVAGLRALREAGLSPAVVATTPLAAGLWSRGTAARILAPAAERDPAGFADALARAASPGDAGIVAYPGTEAMIDAVLDAAARSAAIRLPFAAKATGLLREKVALPTLARPSGLDVVPTIADASAAELLAAEIALPCVVKGPRPGGALNRTRVIRSHEVLRSILSSLPPDEPVLIQPDIRGRLVSLAVVVDREGAVVERFQHLAIETWPPEAGNASYALSLAPDEGLVDRVASFLADVGYFGLAQMDFLDSPAGLALVDVNPRYYGSLSLALASGVNLPAAWHAVVIGTAVPGASPYRVGVTYRWLEADIIAALRGSPQRLVRRAADTGAMWDPADPISSAVLGLTAFGTLAAGRIPRFGRPAAKGAPATPRAPAEEPAQPSADRFERSARPDPRRTDAANDLTV